MNTSNIACRKTNSNSEFFLVVPAQDVPNPEFSIVIPALNEEITIGKFVDWCKEGIAAAEIAAEIVIIDSSTDRTAEIAVARGARVLKVPKRGLGRAYIDAIPHIRGRYVLMGDADCTYDFRNIRPFIEQFRAGAEFIMGSRYKGSIQDGAMAPLHRYFGTPLTTWILNLMYGTHFSDIHCGMRGITLDGLKRLHLASQSWEYASEMIIKSVRQGLVINEVPVHFLKDLPGRTSHHVRAGWFSPWQAGWINLRAMFVFGADFFLMAPGVLLFLLGLVPLGLLALGPITVAGLTLSLNAMLASLFVSIVGLQFFLVGVIAQCLYDGTGRKRRRWVTTFTYTRTFIATAAVFMLGLIAVGRFLAAFINEGHRFTDALIGINHQAIFGTFLMVASVLTFVSMLVIQAIGFIFSDAA